MDHFTAHRLYFITQVETPLELNEHQGSAIRGALYHALRNKFCAFARDKKSQCSSCALALTCPVATLVSTLSLTHSRGRDRPRPYTIQPPVWSGGPGGGGHYIEEEDGRPFFRYLPGETLSFGLTLYAEAMNLFPYVVLATALFEEGGLGRRYEQEGGRRRRGTLRVQEVWAENPLTGERQPVIRGAVHQVQVPEIPVTHALVLDQVRKIEAGERPRGRGLGAEIEGQEQLVTLEFLTPTRLITQGHLLKPGQFHFRAFLHRLLERLEALSEAFSATPLEVDFPALLEAADNVHVVENSLTWEELRSYSTRRHAESPISGLVGRVRLAAPDWSPFWPWLIWGQFVHVGKDTVKGNGMYRFSVNGGSDYG